MAEDRLPDFRTNWSNQSAYSATFFHHLPYYSLYHLIHVMRTTLPPAVELTAMLTMRIKMRRVGLIQQRTGWRTGTMTIHQWEER